MFRQKGKELNLVKLLKYYSTKNYTWYTLFKHLWLFKTNVFLKTLEFLNF